MVVKWSRPGEVKLGWGGDPRVRQLTLGLVETQAIQIGNAPFVWLKVAMW